MWIETRWEIREESTLVVSYQDFIVWVNEKPDRHREAAKEKIESLQRIIQWEDPILFLHRLYYEENKSLIEILKVPEISSIDFLSKATLHRLLFERFWWIPRENTERTKVHERRLSDRVAWEIAEFERHVSNLIGWRNIPRVFRMSEFKQKNYRIGKALYILKTLGGIDKKILYKLSREWWLSDAILAKSLNKELKNILSRNPELNINFEDIELYPQSINRWFRYNTSNIEANDE